MKALQLLFLGPLSIFCLKSTAQVEDLMRNKNITWIAESYNNFLTDSLIPMVEEKIGKRISGATMLKFYNPAAEDMPEEFVLQNFILELAKKEKLPIYKDDKCTQSVSYDIASGKIDTDSVGQIVYELKCTMGKGMLFCENILFFRAHQILYYDSANEQFGLRTLALAPMVKNYKDSLSAWRPLFWIKVDDLKEKRNLSDESITWAKRMTLINGVALKADSVKILKQMNDSLPIASLFQAVLTKPNIPFYRPDSLPSRVKYTFIERQKLFTQRDTLTCISLEPAFKIINNDIHPKDVVGLRLIQNWYWDDTKKRLEIYLVATAPLKNITNEAGEFLYKQPLFYRRTDD